MTKLLALLLASVTLSLAVLLRLPAVTDAPQAEQWGPATPTDSTDQPDESPVRVATAPPARTASAVVNLPRSFGGTQIDGRLQRDTAGNLLIDGDVRRLFDYFLSAMGAEPLARSVQRLRRYIDEQLPEPARTQTQDLLSQYLDYKRQLLALEANSPRTQDLPALRQRLAAVQAMRARLFSPSVHQAFFATEEAYDRFTLERLAIQLTPGLGADAKGAALDQLRAGLSPELQDALLPALQSELRQQTAALQARGGDPEQLRQLRQQLVGTAATRRLEALDRQRLEWERRLAEFQREKSRIELSRGLGEADKQTAIERLVQERFDANERLRLDASVRLANGPGR